MNGIRSEELKKNTLQWTITNFNENKCRCSPSIKINGYKICVSAMPFSSEFIIGEIHLGFWLVAHHFPIYPLSYTMNVVDHRGLDYLARKGTVESNRMIHRFLGFISKANLKQLIIGYGNILTIRFTFEPRMDKWNYSGPFTAASSFLAADNVTQKVDLPVPTKDCSTNTDGESRNLLETLSKDLASFYECQKDTDCVLRVGDVQFPVHRAVLSARSPAFSAMFHYDTVESRSGEVTISDVDCTALADVLYYVYSGKVRGLTVETATSMYTIADKYALLELREECLEFLMCNLSIENIAGAALLAHTHGETELEQRVIQFIEDRIEDVTESTQWKDFSSLKPLLANKLVCTAFVACKKRMKGSKS